MELTKREKRKLRLDKIRHQSQEAQKEHEQNLEHQTNLQQQQKQGKSKYKYYTIAGVIGVVILAAVAYSAYSINKPGPYDNFAKCLNEKGAVMYGAMDWCKYTHAQKAMFGKSFKYINYHEHQDLNGIKKTPTWVINGAWHENVKSLAELAALTGCKI